MKHTKAFRICALSLFFLSLPHLSQAEDARDHETNARDIVKKAVETEIAADKADHSRWLFKETNIQPKKSVTQWVAQSPHGEIKRVIVRNGQPVPQAEQQETINNFLRDTTLQAKQKTDGSKDDKQAETFMRQFPVGFQWTIVGQNDFGIRLHYKPDPNYAPPTREARVLAAMEGDMVVSPTGHRILSLDGHLTEDVTFGFGLFGRLYAGGSFTIQRQEIAPGLWQITRSTTDIKGHALIFKSIAEEETDTKTDFEPLPSNLSLNEAANRALAKPGK